jgi:hypothetical protein
MLKLHLLLTFFARYEISKPKTLSEYKLCLNDGILDSGINSFQVTFFFRKNYTFLTYELYNIKFQFLNVKCGRPIMSQMCSIGFKSGLLAGHGGVVIDSSRK